MKILITGAAGFIASHIADSYIALGHEVVIIDDLSTGKKTNIPQAARFYEAKLGSQAVEKIIQEEKPDVVNHHAAQVSVRTSVEDPCGDAETNIIGSVHLFEAAKKAGVKKLIFASSGGAAYGEQECFPASESHPTNPVSPYGITKLSVEKYLYYYLHNYALPHVILRYANVYGPRQSNHGEAGVIAIFTTKLLQNIEPIINGDGTQTRDYVYVGDVVHCNDEALKENVKGIFNVGTGIETDLNQLTKILLRLTGSDKIPLHGPAKVGEQMRSCLQSGALQKKPVLLEEGLQNTVDWFKTQLKK